MPSLADALIPPDDDSLLSFGSVAITDGDVRVPVTALDEVLVAITRRLVSAGGEQAAVLLLPRGAHEIALLLGISSQLLCRRAPCRLRGPITVVASDVDLGGRLRALGVDGRRRMGLAEGNPLNAHRVRRDGTLQPAHGQYPGDIDQALLYLNTRVQWPELHSAGRGLAILDGTSVTAPDSRANALQWADKHAQVIVAVGDLGDGQLVDAVARRRPDPLVIPLTWTDLKEIGDDLGRKPAAPSLLSTGSLLNRDAPRIELDLVEDEEFDSILSDAYAAMAHMPQGAFPSEVARPVTLIRVGSRLLAQPQDYRTAAALDPANTIQSPVTLLRWLDRPFRPQAPWRSWATVHWGNLVVAARELWNLLEVRHPKLNYLWMLLERLAGEGGNTPIVIRSPSRAASAALRSTLTGPSRTAAQVRVWDMVRPRIVFARFGDRLPWDRDAIEIVPAPPTWMFPLIVGGEAGRLHVLAFPVEARALRRAGERWVETTDQYRMDGEKRLGFDVPGLSDNPVPRPSGAQREPTPGTGSFTVPGLSLFEVFDRALNSLDDREVETSSGRVLLNDQRSLIPVNLVGGLTWWAPSEQQLVVGLTAGGNQNLAVNELYPGLEIIVPTGDGNESVHARLIAACHRNTDVAALDALLNQFRAAARRVLATSRTQAEASERLRSHGGHACAQLPMWANGRTIAPDDPDDVRAVFDAAGQPCPDLRVLYEIAKTLRGLHRSVGQMVSALRSNRSEDALRKLRELVGPVAEELLDEFAVYTVESVEAPRDMPGYLSGRITAR